MHSVNLLSFFYDYSNDSLLRVSIALAGRLSREFLMKLWSPRLIAIQDSASIIIDNFQFFKYLLQNENEKALQYVQFQFSVAVNMVLV